MIATEFGVLQDTACTTGYDQQLIAYLDGHFAGFTAWAWFPGGCTFPALIDDWAGTPSPTGAVVKAALLGYPDDPPASPPRALGPDVNFTFGHGPQGWDFNLFDDPSRLNLAVHPPAGVAAPALSINPADGSPDPGALQVNVHFTAFDQYVDPNVSFFNPRLNLTGKVLHARIRLVSGAFSQGAFQFHASTGDTFAYASTFFGGNASAARRLGAGRPGSGHGDDARVRSVAGGADRRAVPLGFRVGRRHLRRHRRRRLRDRHRHRLTAATPAPVV